MSVGKSSSVVDHNDRRKARFCFNPGMFPRRLRKRLMALRREGRRLKWAISEMPNELHDELLDHLWMVAERVRQLRERGLTFDAIAHRLTIGRDDPRLLWFVRERSDLVHGPRRVSDAEIIVLYDESKSMAEIASMTGETRSHVVRVLQRHGGSTQAHKSDPTRYGGLARERMERMICELRDGPRRKGRSPSFEAIARIVSREFDLKPPITRQRVHHLYEASRKAFSDRPP